MTLTFMGSGSAFVISGDNFQSNILVTVPRSDRALMIDCGSDARNALAALGQSVADIAAVYVSHLHADHIGGLEWLALSTYFNPVLPRPVLYVSAALLNSLWESLRGGLGLTDQGPMTLDDYFDVIPVPENGTFTWSNVDFDLVPMVHVRASDQVMMSYGLFFRIGTSVVYITTDVMFQPQQAERYYREAGLIFHDCETGHPSGVHSSYKDLCTLPADYREKIWLYHHGSQQLPDAKAAGFKGFVQCRQSFHLK